MEYAEGRTPRLRAALITALVLIGGLAMTFASPSPAHAAGGCAGKTYVRTTGNGYASAGVDACFSVNDHDYSADTYITFTSSNPSQWEYCQVTISVYDETAKRELAHANYDCIAQARANSSNARVGPTRFHTDPCDFQPSSLKGHTFTAHVYFVGGWQDRTINTGLLQSPAADPYPC